MVYEIDTGARPGLRRQLLGVPRAPECVWDAAVPVGVMQRVRHGLGMAPPAHDRVRVRAVLEAVAGCAGRGCSITTAEVLESGVSVSELMHGGVSVDDLSACGLDALELREMGWIKEEHEPTLYELGDAPVHALKM
jgi:hypothetical protein